jgi:hypothetical protein
MTSRGVTEVLKNAEAALQNGNPADVAARDFISFISDYQ